MELKDDGMCFACGKKNDFGLKLDFKIQGQTSNTKFVFKKIHQGYSDIVHGGIITTILDEAMGRLLFDLGILSLTVWLEVRFLHSVKVREEVFIKGEIIKQTRKIIESQAEMRLKNGQIVAQAKAKFLRI
ncbi:MAG: PaaI family thioesterase [Nitrospirota bacterium]